VTFKLHLTNGTPDLNGIPFDKANDQVYLNGEFLGWPVWVPGNLPELTNNPVGSDFYQTTLLLNGSRRLQFKYGLSGPNHVSPIDNENPFQRDHVQYVRNNSNPYTLATSEFGTNHFNVLVEPAFGNLKIGAPSGGNVPITWLGYPCTTLQMRTSLTSGSWVDIPATDMLSSTNWPVSGSQQYFRLQRRPLP